MTKKSRKKPGMLRHEKEKTHRRTRKVAFLLNDKENEAIEAYYKKYKINNKSRFLREVVLRTIMSRFLEDYPTLFEKPDLDRLIIKQGTPV